MSVEWALLEKYACLRVKAIEEQYLRELMISDKELWERGREKSERHQLMSGKENDLKNSDCMRFEDEECETSRDTSHSEREKCLLFEEEGEEWAMVTNEKVVFSLANESGDYLTISLLEQTLSEVLSISVAVVVAVAVMRWVQFHQWLMKTWEAGYCAFHVVEDHETRKEANVSHHSHSKSRSFIPHASTRVISLVWIEDSTMGCEPSRFSRKCSSDQSSLTHRERMPTNIPASEKRIDPEIANGNLTWINWVSVRIFSSLSNIFFSRVNGPSASTARHLPNTSQ